MSVLSPAKYLYARTYRRTQKTKTAKAVSYHLISHTLRASSVHARGICKMCFLPSVLSPRFICPVRGGGGGGADSSSSSSRHGESNSFRARSRSYLPARHIQQRDCVHGERLTHSVKLEEPHSLDYSIANSRNMKGSLAHHFSHVPGTRFVHTYIRTIFFWTYLYIVQQ